MNETEFRASEAERAELADLSDRFEAAADRSRGAGAELDAAVASGRWSPELRKVRMSEELFQQLGATRVDWGEPDEDGFYTPSIYR